MTDSSGLVRVSKHVPDWRAACAAEFNCTSSGLVDVNGLPYDNSLCNSTTVPAEVWGITYDTCVSTCRMTQSPNFSIFATVTTTWLLPWLALVAQLPFEASDPKGNVFSGVLSIGSPALVTYSLMLTVMNRRYIRKKFKRLQRSAQERKLDRIAQSVDDASSLVQECQQAPMRANNRDGSLASLIIFPDNQDFWSRAVKDLKNTKRGFTYSFFAQVLTAFVSYFFSFITAASQSLGSPEVGLQFASSIVWTWMFPLVYGYIRVGTQDKPGKIHEALSNSRRNVVVSDYGTRSVFEGSQRGILNSHKLFRPRSINDPIEIEGLCSTNGDRTNNVYPRRSTRRLTNEQDSSQTVQDISPEIDSTLDIPKWLGFDVQGDERAEGPVFNYSRAYTWFHFAQHIHSGFHNLVYRTVADHGKIQDQRIIHGYCGLASDLHAFSEPKESHLPSRTGWNIFCASIAALFLQWGTTGAAFLVAFMTPAVGLGCRSGSYVLYATMSTTSWMSLTFSACMSNKLMNMYENHPNYAEANTSVPIRLTIYRAVAVCTRVFGKLLAIVNVAWLIASSMMEDFGTFETCWCQTDALQYGTSGWTPVFKVAADLKDEALAVWIGGFVFSFLVCIISGLVFTLYTDSS